MTYKSIKYRRRGHELWIYCCISFIVVPFLSVPIKQICHFVSSGKGVSLNNSDNYIQSFEISVTLRVWCLSSTTCSLHENLHVLVLCLKQMLPVWAASPPCVCPFCCCDPTSSSASTCCWCCCSSPPSSSLDDNGTTFTVIGNLDTVLATPIGHTFKDKDSWL